LKKQGLGAPVALGLLFPIERTMPGSVEKRGTRGEEEEQDED